ncbi:MAG: FtsQ-type POTRA domain-containing protein [Legionellales bacterium]|nr:FtsQ-type POTRA domain-containing protein [Legionellales bacterium]
MLKLLKMNFFKEHLWGFFIGIILLSISGYIVYNTNISVENIDIHGDFKYLKPNSIEKVVAPWVNVKIYNIQINNIYHALRDLPWVEKVDVSVRWPNRLLIYIIEKKPVAIWNAHWLIDRNGDLFFPESIPDLDIPRLEGPIDKYRLVYDHFSNINNLLEKKGLKLTSMKYHERSSITINLINGVSIKLGRKEPINRLIRFLRLYDDIMSVGNKDAEVFDLRYPKGIAVKWKK